MGYSNKQVLTDDARTSQNFYESDLILNNYLRKQLSNEAFFYINDKLEKLGGKAATVMNDLSMRADRNPPLLRKRTSLGEPLDRVEFDSAYKELLEIAAESEMLYLKYAPELKKMDGYRHTMGFAAGHLFAMSEIGVYCPLCMTDGAARLIDRFAGEGDKERLLGSLSARSGGELSTGGMFITEKTGGSDVGAIVTEAVRQDRNIYCLNGEKWFCSNVNADVVMTLARTGSREEGTSGLTLFLVEPLLQDRSRNFMDIIRLKDKLGVRSMATGEVRFAETRAKRIGAEGQGFKLMTEMINLSRIYNSVSAVSASRRALIEVYQYLNHRITFGKRTIEHALVREKLTELGSLYVANFYMLWRTIKALDIYDSAGDESEKELLRVLTPLVKWWTADKAVYIVRECMELMGGNGYIEDFILPKLLRDVNVLPIWEGTGNIIVLDVLRAIEKSGGLDQFIQQIDNATNSVDPYGKLLEDKLSGLLSTWERLKKEDLERDVFETAAKPFLEQLIRLYQMAIMLESWDRTSSKWIDPALRYMTGSLENNESFQKPESVERIMGLMGWEY